jgi:hypothetical protein
MPEEGRVPDDDHPGEAARWYARFSFPSSDLSLLDLAQLVTDLDEVYATMAQFVYFDSIASEHAAEVSRPLDEVERPMVVAISRDSPLFLQLMAAGVAVPSLRALAAVLRDPQKLGSYIPKVKSSFYDAEAEALKARARLNKLRDRGKITVKEGRQRIKVKQQQRIKTEQRQRLKLRP